MVGGCFGRESGGAALPSAKMAIMVCLEMSLVLCEKHIDFSTRGVFEFECCIHTFGKCNGLLSSDNYCHDEFGLDWQCYIGINIAEYY